MSKVCDDHAKFDRLVDGELSADEYRALLASLDDEPGGWRRCALAFLESQALAGEVTCVRRGMTLADDEASAIPATLDAARTSPQQQPGSFRLTTILAMAASFLVAFAMGIAMPRLFPDRPGRPELAGNAAGPAVTNVASNAGEANPLRHVSYKPIGNMQLVVDGPGGDSTAVGDVPIYETSGPVNSFLADEQPAISAEVLQALERRGHKIERQVEYVRVRLDDGRDVIVPIERYQIQPPSERPY